MVRAAMQGDFVVRLARVNFYVGLVGVSLLVFRIQSTVTIGDVFLMLSAGSTLLSIGRPRPGLPLGTVLVPAILLILVGGLLSSIVSQDPGDSLANVLRVLYVSVVLPWQAVVLLDTPRRLQRAVMFFCLGAAICATGTVIQFFMGPGVIPGSGVTSAGRYSGFAGHVTDTGAISAIAIVVGAGGLIVGGQAVRKLFLVATFTAGVIGLFLSGSVSGMFASAFGIAVLLVVRGVPLPRLAFVAAVAGAAVIYADRFIGHTQNALGPVQRIQQVFGITGAHASLNTSESRWQTIVLGWHGFLSAPLTGVGLDGDSSAVLGNLGVHNFVVAALYGGGLLFTAGVLIVVCVSLVRACRAIGRERESAAIVVALALTASLFAMTAPSIYNRYFWIPIAFAVALVRLTGTPLEDGRTRYVREPL